MRLPNRALEGSPTAMSVSQRRPILAAIIGFLIAMSGVVASPALAASEDETAVEAAAVDGPRSVNIKLASGNQGLSTQDIVPSSVADSVTDVRPLFTLSTADLERLRVNDELADLSLWRSVELAPGADPAFVLEQLNGNSGIEIAELAPEPVVPPAMANTTSSTVPTFDVTPDFENQQGYLGAAPDGIDADYSKTVNGGDGSGVTIYDLEYAWNQNHEDLDIIAGTSLLLPSGAVAVNPFPEKFGNHGTAVVGQLAATDDGLGNTGISTGADIRLVPTKTTNGFSVANAIVLATDDAEPGDVILIEQQAPVCGFGHPPEDQQTGLGPVEWSQPEFEAIQTAIANGIVVVEAAGNGSVDLDQAGCTGKFDRTVRDSGAIIVGAGAAPGLTARQPLWFTNYGSRLDLQGWGEKVATTGYGYGYIDPSNPGDIDKWYTFTFGGTSSASPIVAGAVANLQGIAKAQTGRPLTPVEVLELLLDTGTPQQGSAKIGPLPNLRAAIEEMDLPGPDVSTVLIIDSSGSMNSNDPQGRRRDAGKAYVAASLASDEVGVVDFDSNATVLQEASVVGSNRSALNAAIGSINSSGGTNLGLGLQEGCDLLIEASGERRAALFFTDGDGSYANQAQCYIDRGWPVYTFGLGNSVNDDLLQQIADQTGGTYKPLSQATNLVCEFQQVRAQIATQPVRSCEPVGTIIQNQVIRFIEQVQQVLKQLTFTTTWEGGSDIQMTITSPSGQVYNRYSSGGDVVAIHGGTYETITVINPEVGEWEVDVLGADIPAGSEPFTFSTLELNDPTGPVVTVEPQTVTETNRNLNVRLKFELDQPADENTTIRYTTVGGTATENVDYAYRTGLVTFRRGQTVRYATIVIRGDIIEEETEALQIALSEPFGLVPGPNGVLTIKDDDGAASTPTVSVVSQTVTETDRNKVVRVVFELDEQAQGTTRVRFNTVEGSASRNVDYTNRSGLVTFARGQTSKTTNIVIRGDKLDEPTEYFDIALSQPTGLLLGSNGRVTIQDNDPPAPPAPTVSVVSKSVVETDRNQTVRVTFTLSEPASATTRVRYTTVADTATKNRDYSHRSGLVTFARGQTSKTATVVVRGDRTVENTERFDIVLSQPTGLQLGNDGTITIFDND